MIQPPTRLLLEGLLHPLEQQPRIMMRKSLRLLLLGKWVLQQRLLLLLLPPPLLVEEKVLLPLLLPLPQPLLLQPLCQDVDLPLDGRV